MSFLYFILSEVLGFICVLYAKWIRDHSGIRFEFAEKMLGTGGTITFIKILGVGLIIFGFFALLNF